VLDPGFSDWNKQLIECLSSLAAAGRGATRIGPAIDAVITFRLGWSPGRAARALLAIDYKDAITLRRLELGDNYKEAGQIDKE
jgi:hypothetical protein